MKLSVLMPYARFRWTAMQDGPTPAVYAALLAKDEASWAAVLSKLKRVNVQLRDSRRIAAYGVATAMMS